MLNFDYSYMEPEDPEAGSLPDGGIFSDFFGAAQDKISHILTPSFGATETGPTVGGQLVDAIYAFGRGKIDQAREKAVGAFLMTSEGKKAQQEGINQTLRQYWPLIVGAILALILLGGMFRAR